MTSELHWVDFKAGVDNRAKQTVVKKDSYSSDSLDELCDTDKSKASSEEIFDLDMNNEKPLSQSSSDISSVHDNSSITSTYSFEIVEETEALQTENITESVDIRISPRNSTVMSYNCSNNFYSEFSLVANVEVKIIDENENADTKSITDQEDIEMHDNRGNAEAGEEVLNEEEKLKKENECVVKGSIPDIQSIDINANANMKEESGQDEEVNTDHEMIIRKKSVDLASEPPSECDSQTPKKTGYYAKKIEISKQEKRMSSSIERKIAEEIKEMKKREEDLKEMRQNLAKEMSEKFAANKIPDSDALLKPQNVALSTPSCDEKPIPRKVTPTPPVENTYKPVYVFAIKRKDVTVKNNNSENNSRSPSANSQKETPVEREIRIAKEREKELKREREQALKAKLEMDSLNSESNETDADSALSICSDSSFDSVGKLAPLFPGSASPEMNNGNGISLYSSSAGSICSLDSLSQRERQNSGFQSAVGSISGSVLSPSPECKPGFPFGTPKNSAEKRGKNVDMERFISSKGREIKFKGMNVGGYCEIKPPQIKKAEEKTCKRFVSAAAKIQNELKEMQEREEQFKKERESLHQDIKNVKNAEDTDPTVKVDNMNESNTPSPIQMNNSDSFEDIEKTNNNKQDNSANTARRRSVLIDEWEQRIQKSFSPP